MLRSDFIALPEWQKILTRMQAIVDECAFNALNEEKDIAVVRFNSGMIKAMQIVKSLPDQLLSDGEKPSPKPTEVIELKNHPRSVQSAF